MCIFFIVGTGSVGTNPVCVRRFCCLCAKVLVPMYEKYVHECLLCVCVRLCAGRQTGGMKHNCTLCLSRFEKNAAAYVPMHQAVVTFTEEAFLQDTNRGQYFSIYTSSLFCQLSFQGCNFAFLQVA